MLEDISVLVVDDEPYYREKIKTLLGDSNIRCALVSSVSEAMGAMEAGFIPDVAIVDWHIPQISGAEDKIYDLDGFALSREILKNREGRTRVIITSMLSLKNIEAEYSKAWGYYCKGKNWDTLKDVVKMGRLKDGEVRKVIVDIQSEFGKSMIDRR